MFQARGIKERVLSPELGGSREGHVFYQDNMARHASMGIVGAFLGRAVKFFQKVLAEICGVMIASRRCRHLEVYDKM